MNLGIRARLSLMMFIQFFIWSVWWVPMGSYMAKNGFGSIIGQVYATQGYAAILAPLFVGVIADRYFSAEKLLGGGGGALLWTQLDDVKAQLEPTVLLAVAGRARPSARGALLMFLLVIVFFGVLQLKTAEVLVMGALCALAYGAVILLLTLEWLLRKGQKLV